VQPKHTAAQNYISNLAIFSASVYELYHTPVSSNVTITMNSENHCHEGHEACEAGTAGAQLNAVGATECAPGQFESCSPAQGYVWGAHVASSIDDFSNLSYVHTFLMNNGLCKEADAVMAKIREENVQLQLQNLACLVQNCAEVAEAALSGATFMHDDALMGQQEVQDGMDKLRAGLLQLEEDFQNAVGSGDSADDGDDDGDIIIPEDELCDEYMGWVPAYGGENHAVYARKVVKAFKRFLWRLMDRDYKQLREYADNALDDVWGELNTDQEKITGLEDGAADSKERIAALETVVQGLTGQVGRGDAKICALEEDNKELRATNASLTERMDAMDARMREIMDAVGKRSLDSTQSTDTERRLREEAEARSKEAEARLAEMDARLKEAEARLAEMQDSLATMQASIFKMEGAVEDIGIDQQQCRSDIRDMSPKISERRSALEDLEIELRRIKKGSQDLSSKAPEDRTVLENFVIDLLQCKSDVVVLKLTRSEQCRSMMLLDALSRDVFQLAQFVGMDARCVEASGSNPISVAKKMEVPGISNENCEFIFIVLGSFMIVERKPLQEALSLVKRVGGFDQLKEMKDRGLIGMPPAWADVEARAEEMQTKAAKPNRPSIPGVKQPRVKQQPNPVPTGPLKASETSASPAIGGLVGEVLRKLLDELKKNMNDTRDEDMKKFMLWEAGMRQLAENHTVFETALNSFMEAHTSEMSDVELRFCSLMKDMEKLDLKKELEFPKTNKDVLTSKAKDMMNIGDLIALCNATNSAPKDSRSAARRK
jgi:hypothetical protein